jgi:hypothetical protein
MMTGRQRTIARFADCTGAAAVGRHQILAELTHPHAPPGTWLAAGLVVWILSSDEVTRRLRDLLQAWRGSPGPQPGAGEGGATETPACDPGMRHDVPRGGPRTSWPGRALLRSLRLRQPGSYVSMFGSRITTIACPLLALYLTNSPVDAGIAFAATVPSVFVYLPAGALVEHWDPRRTLLACESAGVGLSPPGRGCRGGPAAPQALPLLGPGIRHDVRGGRDLVNR